MSDRERRELERQAAKGGPGAQRRLAYHRCRTGECCGHALEMRLRVPPPEGANRVFLLDLTAEPPDYSGRHPRPPQEAVLTVQLLGRGKDDLRETFEWLRGALMHGLPGMTGESPPSIAELFSQPKEDR